VVFLSQKSSTTTTTTTTTTTSANSNINESLLSSTHSILPPPLPPSSIDHQISIRPKLSLIHQHQELVPVIPKINTEYYESITRQLSNHDTTNLLDNDSNDPKQKYPRPIRPRPSLRGQAYKSVGNKTKSSIANHHSPSSRTNYLSQSSLEHQIDHSSQLMHSKSLDLSVPSTNNILSSASLPTTANKKSKVRNRKKTSAASVTALPNNQILVPIAPNLGRTLAPARLNVQRMITGNNPITKRSTTTKKQVKRNSKTLVQ
jgi:hypothetical protein